MLRFELKTHKLTSMRTSPNVIKSGQIYHFPYLPHLSSHNDFVFGLRNFFQNDLSAFDFDRNLSQIEPWASYYADHTDLVRMREDR